jgi:hypothetical protein
VFLSFVFLRNVNKFEITVHLHMDDIKIILYLVLGAFWLITAVVKKGKKQVPTKPKPVPTNTFPPRSVSEYEAAEAKKRYEASRRALLETYQKWSGEPDMTSTEDEEMAMAGSLEAISSETLPKVKKGAEDAAYQTKDLSARTPLQEEFRNAIIWQAILNRPHT